MGNYPSRWEGDDLPVETVDWYEAVEFCNKLSVKEGLAPAYRGSGDNIVCDFSASGCRLPTEAEWEYAARGANRDAIYYEYSGSNSADSVAWYGDNSDSETHPVGTKQPNSLGIYDMSGNVWEWCWDWYGNYSGGAQSNPTGASSGSDRVRRGGGWGNSASGVRSAGRAGNDPSDRGYGIGFRVARSASP
jgi:formylglycine-generating enzyme required for sulfatase activity